MSTVQFNAHDLTLAATALLCVLLSIVYLVAQKERHPSSVFLVGFLVAHALIALHELSYYGIQFRYTVLELSPNLFFIGSFGYCVDAVLLYFFTRAVIFRDVNYRKTEIFHFLPLLLYIAYMISAYYTLDYWPKRIAIWEWRLSSSWQYVVTELLIRCLRVIYAFSCLRLIARYRARQQQLRANTSAVDLGWLRMLVIGFLCVMAGEAMLSLVKVINLFSHVEISVLSTLGVLTYYATFVLLFALLVYSIVNLSSVDQIMQEENTATDADSAFKPDYVARIEDCMREKKPFLSPEITLETLAHEIGVSGRALSVTLNQHFQMNFYEFINRYRIEEAKKMLVADTSRSITEIFYEVGFNSKSVFNTFFRKCEGMTPSAYRKSQAEVQTSDHTTG